MTNSSIPIDFSDDHENDKLDIINNETGKQREKAKILFYPSC